MDHSNGNMRLHAQHRMGQSQVQEFGGSVLGFSQVAKTAVCDAVVVYAVGWCHEEFTSMHTDHKM